MAAVAGARAAGERLGVEVLAGCELTATVGDRVVHVLLYGEGLLEPDLADAVEVARRGRDERNQAIGERLERLCGVGHADAVEVAGASALSRAHFARAMVARGVVADVAEAFDRYLSSGRPAYVPAPSVPVTDAVAIAAKAGGVAVLAHPGRLAAGERDRVLGEAIEAGIDGVEVWHSQHDAEPAPVPGRPGRAARPAGHRRVRLPRPAQAGRPHRHRQGRQRRRSRRAPGRPAGPIGHRRAGLSRLRTARNAERGKGGTPDDRCVHDCCRWRHCS